MATYAVGDIQGCFREFEQLLSLISFQSGRDRLWLVGDLVNRGPQSLEVLRYVRQMGEDATVVLGNHDLHLLAVSEQFTGEKPGDTLAPILNAPDAAALLDWLRFRPMIHREGNLVLVHAGLLPQWSVDKALSLGAEVEQSLQSVGYRDFLRNLYGSKPDHWSEQVQGFDRLRVIVNAMTRMRFCSTAGVMEFKSKGELKSAPEGFLPWFEVPGRQSSDAAIVCGHWSALGVHLAGNLMAIDSGCVWGGKLTAIRLEDRQMFQVPCQAVHPVPSV